MIIPLFDHMTGVFLHQLINLFYVFTGSHHIFCKQISKNVMKPEIEIFATISISGLAKLTRIICKKVFFQKLFTYIDRVQYFSNF